LGGSTQALESLSYVPARFDEAQTVDPERSQARYSKIVVHSMRARTQKRSKAWEEWARAAVVGQQVTLLKEVPQVAEESAVAFERMTATYRLDRNLTKLTLLTSAAGAADIAPITIAVQSIQVICPTSDFMLLFSQVDSLLDESELRRAVLIQYLSDASERRRVCFLEQSDAAKDEFVQALTALWLEKRNDHSMWF